jgi:kojibiose phosphorylase
MSEVAGWRRVADNLYLNGKGKDTLLEQFEGFFELADIDVRKYEPRTAALDVILGRERTQATQLVKQADVVMLLYLLEDQFTEEERRANFHYYERRTGHGSSLSPSIYGLVAARLGLVELATSYFHKAGQVDLANNMGNAIGGVHAAALGGLWLLTIKGLAGLRPLDEGIFVNPLLPRRWRRLSFALLWRGSRLKFEIARRQKMLVTTEGEGSFSMGVYGKQLQVLEAGKAYLSTWERGAWQEFVEQE